MLHRPAAAAPRLRRPAAAVEDQRTQEEGFPKKKKKSEVNLRDLLRLGTICIEEAIYYGKTAAVAGRVVGFRSEENEIYLDLAASGTKK